MILPRFGYLLYLGNCYAYGWQPSERGLEAFLLQRAAGWRDTKTGQMTWPGEQKESEMEDSTSKGFVVVDVSEYNRLVKDMILEQVRADNLQQRSITLIDEVDHLSKELDAVKADLDETTSKLETSDNSVSYWIKRCDELKKELERFSLTADLEEDTEQRSVAVKTSVQT